MKSLFKALLSPLSFIYLFFYLLRWTFYYFGLFPKVVIPPPVVSVGNITMGGSGKTPFLLYLLKKMSEKGVRAGVVTRSYRASAKKATLLPRPGPQVLDAKIFGDEACLIKNAYPDVPVVTGPRKSASAQWITQEEDLQVVLVDDGFQHWRLKRDLDIVLLDVTEEDHDWAVLPMGKAREPFAALGRAQVVILTKTNLVSRERVEAVYKRISARVAPELPLLCEAQHEITGLRELGDGQLLPLDALRGQKIVLLSGLAKPQGFEQLVAQSGLGPIVHHLKLQDHQAPSQKDLESLLGACRTLNCKNVLMTQKDAVKWTFKDKDLKFYETQLSFQVSRNEDQLWQKIGELTL